MFSPGNSNVTLTTTSQTPKKIIAIFLDIDGVLFNNRCDGSVQRRVEERYVERGLSVPPGVLSNKDCDAAAVDLFDKDAIKNLELLVNHITENGYDAAIILSSDWRRKGDVEALKKLFEQHHFAQFIFDKTIDDTVLNVEQYANILGHRNLEINHWLQTKGVTHNVCNHIILDDVDYNLSNRFGNAFIHCRKLFNLEGLSLAKSFLALSPPKLSDSPSVQATNGRRNFDNIKTPGAGMARAKSDYVSYNHANLSNVDFYQAELSLCELRGTNFAGACLTQATFICSSFSSETIFSSNAKQADVGNALFILSTYDEGRPITREWLKAKGAKNSDNAITDIDSLYEILNSATMGEETASHLSDKINSIYGLLNSMKIRKETSLFMKTEWLPLLEYSTDQNLSVLSKLLSC